MDLYHYTKYPIEMVEMAPKEPEETTSDGPTIRMNGPRRRYAPR